MTASQHPADRLIRELVDSGRSASAQEIAAIVARVASAPFSERVHAVPAEFRSAVYRGQPLGARATSLAIHLAQRTVGESQWADGTTEIEFLADIGRAVQAPAARVTVYHRQGGYIAGTLTPTELAVPGQRRGEKTEPWLYVVYSADRGMIISAYQASGLDAIHIPQEARWLR